MVVQRIQPRAMGPVGQPRRDQLAPVIEMLRSWTEIWAGMAYTMERVDLSVLPHEDTATLVTIAHKVATGSLTREEGEHFLALLR